MVSLSNQKVYRLGLRLEEIDEEISDQIRQQQQHPKPSTATGNNEYEDNLLNGDGVDQSSSSDSVVEEGGDDPLLNKRYLSR